MKRRLLAVILTAAILSECTACSVAEQDTKEAQSVKETHSVFVESEFAPLKKVIVSQTEATDQTVLLAENYVPLGDVLV